ncbi:MAG: hypothetical protein H6742_19890 [Alphaproteobacteria bacterium]|nr:hypothetical protein [Alphaproteobacteria bacterium]
MLALVQRQLQALYRVDAPEIGPFLMNEAQLDEVLGEDRRPADEWVLVRQEDDALDLGVFIADSHLQALSSVAHLAEAAHACFRALCAAVEGVSHFLLLVDRAQRGEPVSMLELETQAEVDKYLTAALHQPERRAEWSRRLFDDAALADGLSPDEQHRYTEAARLARAWVGQLERLPHTQAIIDQQRDFWRQSGHRRMQRLRALAG